LNPKDEELATHGSHYNPMKGKIAREEENLDCSRPPPSSRS